MRDAAAARETGASEIADLQTRIAQAQKAHQVLLEDPPARTGLMDLLSGSTPTLWPRRRRRRRKPSRTPTRRCEEALDALSVGACTFGVLAGLPGRSIDSSRHCQRHAGLTEKIARADERLERSRKTSPR